MRTTLFTEDSDLEVVARARELPSIAPKRSW